MNKTDSGLKIAFFCSYPFHFYVFKNIIRHLPKAEFLIGGRNLTDTQQNWQMRIKKTADLCQLLNRPINIIPFVGVSKNYFNRYKVIVAAHGGYILSYNLPSRIKLVRVQYGPGKDLKDFGVWNRKFDLILAHGLYSYKRLGALADCKIVGYPKFDDWFLGKVNPLVLKNKTDFDSRKKTVLYLPTHGALASYWDFGKALKELLPSFNILLKPHHETIYWDSEFYRAFNRPDIFVFDDSHDILELFALADVIVCDSGGAVFDALLADKPMVILSSNGTNFKEKPSLVNNFCVNATHDRSIDEIIKQPKNQFCEIVNYSDGLKKAIWRAEVIYHQNQKRRRILKKKLFAFNDGYNGQRAAQAIVELEKANKPKPTLLSLTIDDELAQHQIQAKYWKQKSQYYERIKKFSLYEKLKFFIKEFFV